MKNKLIFWCLMILSGTIAVAQPNYDATMKYGFFSNWSLGFNLQGTQVYKSNAIFGQGANIGASISLIKKVSPNWNLRVSGTIPGFMGPEETDSIRFDRTGLAEVGVEWFPWTHGFYVSAGAGASLWTAQRWRANLTAEALIGYRQYITTHSAVEANAGVRHIHKSIYYDGRTDFFAGIGYIYSFGVTKMDELILDEKALLEDQWVETGKANEALIDAMQDTITYFVGVVEDEEMLIDRMHDTIYNLQELVGSLQDTLNGTRRITRADAVAFNINQYSISKDQKAYLNEVVKSIKKDTGTYYIFGYADSFTGTPEYNQKLASKRAQSVYDYMISKGVPGSRLEWKGNGTNIPMGNSKSATSRKVLIIKK